MVDILLTDIYMPGMSGLEMHEIIHGSNPNCHAIFLTGYDEFDDIYRATRAQNTRYLSKTEEDGEIVRAVLETARKLTKEKEWIDQSLLGQNMLQMLGQRELMLRILLGGYGPDDLTERQLRWHGVPFMPEEPVILLTGGITETPKGQHPAERMDMLNRMYALFHSQFSRGFELVQIDCRPAIIVWVLQRRPSGGAMSLPKLRSMLEDYSSACYETQGVGLSFLVCEKPMRLSELSRRFAQAESSIGIMLGRERGMVLSADGEANEALPPQIEEAGMREALRALAGLQVALEQGSREKVNAQLGRILPALAASKSRHSLQAAELFFGISSVLAGCINRLRIMDEIAFKISIGRLTVWSDFADWQEAADYFSQLCGIVVGILENKFHTGGDVVGRVTEYIDQHLGEDLSLTKIGESVNYNPAYLSRVFKRVTGKNISAAITQRRLRKATGLLLGTNQTVAQIAHQCGIGNAQYFITVFRKHYGATPQEYRVSEIPEISGRAPQIDAKNRGMV
jgi:two-component system response regulator YesN